MSDIFERLKQNTLEDICSIRYSDERRMKTHFSLCLTNATVWALQKVIYLAPHIVWILSQCRVFVLMIHLSWGGTPSNLATIHTGEPHWLGRYNITPSSSIVSDNHRSIAVAKSSFCKGVTLQVLYLVVAEM